MLEAGQGGFSVHADGFTRDTDDYRVHAGTGLRSPIINSASAAKGGALGGSYQFAKGYIGAARSEYRSNYGTVAEPTVRINMQQRRDTVEANFNSLGGLIDGIFAKASQSDYQHTEKDAGVPQTTFKNKGEDFRLELKHAKFDGFQGVVGVLVGVAVAVGVAAPIVPTLVAPAGSLPTKASCPRRAASVESFRTPRL